MLIGEFATLILSNDGIHVIVYTQSPAKRPRTLVFYDSVSYKEEIGASPNGDEIDQHKRHTADQRLCRQRGSLANVFLLVKIVMLMMRGFDMGDVLVGGTSTGFFANGCAVIAESGTSLLAGPIGATGVMSQQCKTLVNQYGKDIIKMLLYEDILIRASRLKKVMADKGKKSSMETFVPNDKADYYSGITSITVNEKNAYELKGKLLDDLHNNAFSGTNGKVAVEHIEYYIKIIDPIKLPNVDHDKLRIVVFPISLARGARRWFDRTKESITCWVDLTAKFFGKYYPPSRIEGNNTPVIKWGPTNPRFEGWYGYCKNLKKTVKTGQTRTRERKSTQRAGRMLSKVNSGQLKSTFSQTCSTQKDKIKKNPKSVPQS
ncbi:reverse transcriptase domain-containing protein [Tanacetum coccineum]